MKLFFVYEKYTTTVCLLHMRLQLLPTNVTHDPDDIVRPIGQTFSFDRGYNLYGVSISLGLMQIETVDNNTLVEKQNTYYNITHCYKPGLDSKIWKTDRIYHVCCIGYLPNLQHELSVRSCDLS